MIWYIQAYGKICANRGKSMEGELLNRFIMADRLPEKAILTDDPARVRMIVSHYLDYAETLYEYRGMIGCYGEYRGCGMGIISCGFGSSAARLYLEEMARLGVGEAIYLGEAISLTLEIDLMDVIVADGGHLELWKRIAEVAAITHVPIKRMETITDDCFWCEGVNVQEERGWDIADFAANTIYATAGKLHVTAAVILTVSENTVKATQISEETRQIGFSEAAVLALKAMSKKM
jgi:purine-nucleoside phosphorylase